LDIAGAKALKERLGQNGASEAPPSSVEVPEDAPPVYRWLGVSKDPDTRTADDDEPSAASASLFRRLALSFR
jgi:hypothetical protein